MVSDPVAIVTGASRGIGKAIAAGLAGEGYQLVLIARNQALLNSLQQEITAMNGCPPPTCFAFDINRTGIIKKCIRQVIHDYGKTVLWLLSLSKECRIKEIVIEPSKNIL